MSLCERSNGLLETHVTWSDIELDMQDAMGTVATFGPNKKVINIGEGNIISQLTIVDYSAKVDQGLPVDIEHFKGMENKIKEMHNVEAKVYELIQKYGQGKIPHTKIYKTRSFNEENCSKGYLLMEFIEGLSTVHVVNNVQPEELHEILRALSSFERITFEMSEDEKVLFNKRIFGEFTAESFTDEVNETILNQLEKLAGPELFEQISRAREAVPELMKPANMAKLDEISKVLGMTPVLCHADMWSTNMLWSKKDGKHQVRAIIDYQTAHIGCAAADLGRLFCSLLGGKARRDNWESLVEKFYGYVKEEMKDNIPYTLEQNSTAVVHEKLACLLEDLVDGFERNQKIQMSS